MFKWNFNTPKSRSPRGTRKDPSPCPEVTRLEPPREMILCIGQVKLLVPVAVLSSVGSIHFWKSWLETTPDQFHLWSSWNIQGPSRGYVLSAKKCGFGVRSVKVSGTVPGGMVIEKAQIMHRRTDCLEAVR